MKKFLSATLCGAAMAVASAVLALQAQAQDYPAREIRVYCGFPAGSGADIIVRFFTERLQAAAGKPLIVENRPGAFGNIAAEAAARARPDGYSLLITPAAPVASNFHLFKKLAYDPVKDFVPVTTLARQGFVLVVNPKLPINSVADLTAMLKQKGDKSSYGAPNPFAFAAAELYKSIIGSNSVAVNYPTTAPAFAEMLDGQLDFVFSESVFALEQIRAGRGRALAVTMAQRLAQAPELPTMAEAGVPGYALMGWWMAMFPAETPAPIAKRVETWLNQIVSSEDTRKFLFNIGLEPFVGSAEILARQQADDLVKWGDLYTKANIPRL